eukprot:scaffold45490_cov54-Phaeocystis_antarctica.AAC.4
MPRAHTRRPRSPPPPAQPTPPSARPPPAPPRPVSPGQAPASPGLRAELAVRVVARRVGARCSRRERPARRGGWLTISRWWRAWISDVVGNCQEVEGGEEANVERGGEVFAPLRRVETDSSKR